MQCNKGRWLRRVEVQIRVFQRQKGRGKFHAAQTKVRAVRDVFFFQVMNCGVFAVPHKSKSKSLLAKTAVRLWHFVRKFKSIIWLVQRSDFSFPLPCQYRFLLQPLNTHILVRDSIIVLFSFFQRAVKNTFVFAWKLWSLSYLFHFWVVPTSCFFSFTYVWCTFEKLDGRHRGLLLGWHWPHAGTLDHNSLTQPGITSN